MFYFYLFLLVLVVMEIAAVFIRGRKTWGTTPFVSSGCNLFNSVGRMPCCVEHDKAYRRGGWVIARLQADWKLFKCIWKQNILLAIIMFIGVRAFSMFAFQYGKKRKLYYPDGTTD